jgi:hypothetical protein
MTALRGDPAVMRKRRATSPATSDAGPSAIFCGKVTARREMSFQVVAEEV